MPKSSSSLFSYYYCLYLFAVTTVISDLIIQRRSHCSSSYSVATAFVYPTTTASTTTFRNTTPLAFIDKTTSSSSSSPSRTIPSSQNNQNKMTTTTAIAISNDIENIPGLDVKDIEQLVGTANSFASANGLEIEKRNTDSSSSSSSSYYVTAPVSLLPNAIPRTAFTNAQSLAPLFNELVDRVSRQPEFLYRTLIDTGVAQADPYTNQLLVLHKQIYGGGGDKDSPAKLADSFNIHRSDYFLNANGELRQIELNTIAASFASLSCQVSAMHRYITTRFQNQVQDFLQQKVQTINPENIEGKGEVPENDAIRALTTGMALAVQRYQTRFIDSASTPGEKRKHQYPLIVLFVVQDGETNTVDQRMLEFRLWSDHEIPVVRMSLANIYKRVTNDDGILILDDTYEIALVYYRAGYAPTDYPSGYDLDNKKDGVEWLARAKLENSRATKAPSLSYHLVGTKKVQQQLARPGILEQFYDTTSEDDMNKIQQMRNSFAGLWSLGTADATEEDLNAVKRALDGTHNDDYVLKPQREGGGYNFYGIDVANKIRPLVQEKEDGSIVLDPKLGEYILMERIFPKLQSALLLRNGQVEGYGPTLSELGIYGYILSSHDGQILNNEYAGFLLRTKFANVNEGGVASGFATVSSPYLC